MKRIMSILLLIAALFMMNGCIHSTKNQNKFEYPNLTEDVTFDVLLPTYVPEGYKFEEYHISPLSVSVTYSSEGKTLYYMQHAPISLTYTIDTENSVQTEYHSDRFDGYILSYETSNPSNLIHVWDENNFYKADGDVDKEELIKMIESIEVYF